MGRHKKDYETPSEESEIEEEERRSKKKSSHKKRKKHKKEKKKRKKHKKSRSRSRSPLKRSGSEESDGEINASTDKEGGTTPEQIESEEETFRLEKTPPRQVRQVEEPLGSDYEEGEIDEEEPASEIEISEEEEVELDEYELDRRSRRHRESPEARRGYDRSPGRDRRRRHRGDRSPDDRRRHPRRRSRSPVQRSPGQHSRSPVQRLRSPVHRSASPVRRSRSPRSREESSGPVHGDDVQVQNQGGVISMSVEETNKLREKLGLPPLRMGGKKEKKKELADMLESVTPGESDNSNLEGTLIPNSSKSERHKPAENLSQKSYAEKLRERLALRREKRKHEAKLLTVKTLGDSDSDDDASNWIKKQKRKQKEKKEAERRAKMLADLDDEFGVGALVEEEAKKEREKQYGKNELRGLKVEHSVDKFQEGKAVILTLKDADILDDKADDTLVNVNIVDDERVAKNIENIKKAKAGGYSAYDNEYVDDITGEVKKKNMLDKYDEELEGEKKSAFVIGERGEYDEEEEIRREREKIKKKLNARMVETLETPVLKVASDYFTPEETVKFKKPKKKKKVKKKMLKADDLLKDLESSAPPTELGSRSKKKQLVDYAEDDNDTANARSSIPMDIDDDDDIDLSSLQDTSNVKVDVEDDLELHIALHKTRKLKQKEKKKDVAEEILNMTEKLPQNEDYTRNASEFIGTFMDDQKHQSIILNDTSEFCRNLGAWRSTESGYKESVHKDLLEFEDSLKPEAQRGTWEEVGSDEDMSDSRLEPSDVARPERPTTILDDEPDLGMGVAGAIKLASNKGYWETEDKDRKSSNLQHLMAKSYSIDDKIRDDDRGRGRERYGGPSMPFQEKAGYKPHVQLEYIDDTGRLLNQKEAFRYLSHKFHGKGSGKLKTEKRMKKIQEDSMMKNMSSTDTPLNTLDKQQKRQKECQTPFLVISGNKSNPTDIRK